MKCLDCQNELAVRFGAELPQALQDHLDACDECRTYWNELFDIQRVLPDDKEFYPSSLDSERLASAVMQSLPSRPPAALHSGRGRLADLIRGLLRPRPLGAAVVSALVLALGLWWVASTPTGPTMDTSAVIAELSSDYISDTTLYEPETETVALLVDELTVWEPATAARSVLDDISDEEYQYLAKNLTVEDIL